MNYSFLFLYDMKPVSRDPLFHHPSITGRNSPEVEFHILYQSCTIKWELQYSPIWSGTSHPFFKAFFSFWCQLIRVRVRRKYSASETTCSSLSRHNCAWMVQIRESNLTETGEGEEGQVGVSWPTGRGEKKKKELLLQRKKNIQLFFSSTCPVLPLAPLAWGFEFSHNRSPEYGLTLA